MAYCFIEKHVNVPGTMWCECGSLVAGMPIDGYNVLGYLGHGTSSDVYLAEQPALNNRKVVIKIAHRSWNQADIDNFRREAELLASLSHPYILPIYAYGVIVERQPSAFTYSPYLVLPYAEQGSLEDAFMRSGKRPLPLMRVVSLAQEVAEALDYAHSRGVLHRDVKPANLLSMGSHVLLSDFSVASLIDVEVSHVSAPLAGSPAYMAPEVWRQSPGRYSDQYALAVTCFRLLAGDYPWGKMNEGDVQEWLHMHCHVPPRSLQAYRPNLPGAVDLVLQMGMAKDPHKRYENVQAFAADLLEASEEKTQTLDKRDLASAMSRVPAARPLDVQTAGKEWQQAAAKVVALNRTPTFGTSTDEDDDPITVAIEPVTERMQENTGPSTERSGARILRQGRHKAQPLQDDTPDSSPPEAIIQSRVREGPPPEVVIQSKAKDLAPTAKEKPAAPTSRAVILSSAKDLSPGPALMHRSLSGSGRQPREQVTRRSSVQGPIYRAPTRRWLWSALVLNVLICVLLAAEAYWQSKNMISAVNLLGALWPSVLMAPLLARWFRRIHLRTFSWGVFWGVFFGMTNALLSGLVCYMWVALAMTVPHWGHDWRYAGDGVRIFVTQVVNLAQPALTPLLLGLWLATLGGALLGIFVYRGARREKESAVSGLSF